VVCFVVLQQVFPQVVEVRQGLLAHAVSSQLRGWAVVVGPRWEPPLVWVPGFLQARLLRPSPMEQGRRAWCLC
jgi:hypothetical protein